MPIRWDLRTIRFIHIHCEAMTRRPFITSFFSRACYHWNLRETFFKLLCAFVYMRWMFISLLILWMLLNRLLLRLYSQILCHVHHHDFYSFHYGSHSGYILHYVRQLPSLFFHFVNGWVLSLEHHFLLKCYFLGSIS